MVKIVVMNYNLKYYDCTKPENLKLFNKVCVNENSAENGDMEEWTLLQIEQWRLMGGVVRLGRAPLSTSVAPSAISRS